MPEIGLRLFPPIGQALYLLIIADMSYLLSRVHALPRQQVINFTPVTINIIQTRNIKRFKKYGAEEGHDNKNEVRKERWIKNEYTGGEGRRRIQ